MAKRKKPAKAGGKGASHAGGSEKEGAGKKVPPGMPKPASSGAEKNSMKGGLLPKGPKVMPEKETTLAIVVFLIALAVFLFIFSAQESRLSDYIFDSHAYYMYFLDGGEEQELFAQMDEAGVGKAVLLGSEVKKWWAGNIKEATVHYTDPFSREYYFEDSDELLAELYWGLPEERRARVYPFASAFESSELGAVVYLEDTFTKRPYFCGIGEVALGNYSESRPVFSFAEKYRLPVLIEYEIKEGDAQALEDALAAHPDVPFILANAGMGEEPETGHVEELRLLLSAHDNLYPAISWKVLSSGIYKGGKLQEQWVYLIEDYPGRFVVGSGVIADFEEYETIMGQYDLLWNSLGDETVERVKRQNMDRVFSKVKEYCVKEE